MKLFLVETICTFAASFNPAALSTRNLGGIPDLMNTDRQYSVFLETYLHVYIARFLHIHVYIARAFYTFLHISHTFLHIARAFYILTFHIARALLGVHTLFISCKIPKLI